MKPEEIREIADREATATSPNNRIRARLYAGTLNRQITEALRILEQAGYVVVPKEPTEEMRRLERERDRWKEDCLALARPGRIVPPHGSGP